MCVAPVWLTRVACCARQHVVIGDHGHRRTHYVFVEWLDVGVFVATPVGLRDTTTTPVPGRHDDPVRLRGIRNADLRAVELPPASSPSACRQCRAARFVESRRHDRARGDSPARKLSCCESDARSREPQSRPSTPNAGPVVPCLPISVSSRRKLRQSYPVAA